MADDRQGGRGCADQGQRTSGTSEEEWRRGVTTSSIHATISCHPHTIRDSSCNNLLHTERFSCTSPRGAAVSSRIFFMRHYTMIQTFMLRRLVVRVGLGVVLLEEREELLGALSRVLGRSGSSLG